MNNQKYKVIGEKYGIIITRPWTEQMYKHNSKVREILLNKLQNVLHEGYTKKDNDLLQRILQLLTGIKYHQGYSIKELYNIGMEELQIVPNFWLHQEYDTLCALIERDPNTTDDNYFIGY